MEEPQIIRLPGTLVDALGIELLKPAEEEPRTVHARMAVDSRTGQVFGYLSGGASLALAESLAGFGSVLNLPPDRKPVGSTVSAQHVRPVAIGGRVSATATLLHKGRTTHLWNVDIVDEEGRLVSTARVLNLVVALPARS